MKVEELIKNSVQMEGKNVIVLGQTGGGMTFTSKLKQIKSMKKK